MPGSPSTDPRLAAALDYAAAGLPVLPLDGKIPRNRGGLTNASTDPAVIAEWWRRWPSANVGIRTGAECGLVVLDVDTPKGGAGTLAELERKHGKLPATARVLTGGGGEHIYFRHPGRELRNSAGRLGAGLDTRGDGGYVVAPPSDPRERPPVQVAPHARPRPRRLPRVAARGRRAAAERSGATCRRRDPGGASGTTRLRASPGACGAGGWPRPRSSPR